jgi:hypothetical protein
VFVGTCGFEARFGDQMPKPVTRPRHTRDVALLIDGKLTVEVGAGRIRTCHTGLFVTARDKRNETLTGKP